MAMWRTRATKGAHTVEVLHDDGDLGHIWVVDPRWNPPEYIKCSSIHPEYFDGLTRWQDEEIRAALRAEGEKTTPENLVAKKQQLFRHAQSETRKRGKKKVDRKAAKFQDPTAPLHRDLPGTPPSDAASHAPSGQLSDEPGSKRPKAAPRHVSRSTALTGRRDLYDDP